MEVELAYWGGVVYGDGSYLVVSFVRAAYALPMVSMPFLIEMVRFPLSSLNWRSLPQAVALERMVEKIGLR